MLLNKFTKAMLIAGLSLPVIASAATLSMNDDTNTITGLDTSEMISKDNGSHWTAYTDASQNSFMGDVTVIVASKDDNAIKAVDYDASTTYDVAGTMVRYNGYYWTSKWWTQGDVPGSSDVWQKGSAININKLATFTFTPYSGQKATDFQNSEKAKVAAQRKVIGYFPEWGVYEAHNKFTADKINYSQLTHLNYGFALVENGVVTIHDGYAAGPQLPLLKKLTEENNVTYMISVGGWNNSLEGVFEAATATAAGVEKLANSMISFMQQWGFDGIDVDWEYPDTTAEQAQFTSLIQSLRSKLDDLGKRKDKYFQLSAAVTTNHNNIGFINPKVTAPLLDSVNVMAYDIHGAFDSITGHNAPLFANSKDSDPLLNVASTMKEYNETWDVPKSKLMMGVPYYGRGWGSVEPTEIVKGLPGLFAAGSATVHGAWDDSGQFTGTNPYYVLKEKLASGDYTRYWDSESKVPYLYDAATKEFLTYDDSESIQTKVNYINSEGFGGAIIWDLSGDTSDYELGNIVGTLKGTTMPDGDDDVDDDDTIQPLAITDGVYKSAYNNMCFGAPTGRPNFGTCTGASDQKLHGLKTNELQYTSYGQKCVAVDAAGVAVFGTSCTSGGQTAPELQQWSYVNGKFMNVGTKTCLSSKNSQPSMAACDDNDTTQKLSWTNVYNTGIFQANSAAKCLGVNPTLNGLAAAKTCDGNYQQRVRFVTNGYPQLQVMRTTTATGCFNAPVTQYGIVGNAITVESCNQNVEGMRWEFIDGQFVSQSLTSEGSKLCLAVGKGNDAYVYVQKCNSADTTQVFKEIN